MGIKVNRIAMTTEGLIEGIPQSTTLFTVFKGIPYAAPPVGKLRWRDPQPPHKHDEMLHCCKFAPAAPQALYRVNASGDKLPKEADADSNNVDFEESEDCLYLNIWTPDVNPDANLPVLFWIHGGRYTGGSSFEDHVDGEIFCRNQAIFVSVGYRLGVFANMAHPEIRLKSDLHACGTLGVLDLIQALKWLKNNIQVFGGDPNNITIGGQSAGGNLTDALLVSPLSQGLFRRAVIHSTGILLDTDTHYEIEKAERIGVEICKRLNLTFEQLQMLPTDQAHKMIMKAANEIEELEFMPVIDGVVFKEQVYATLSKGEHVDVDILVSSVSGDSVIGKFKPTTASNFANLAKAVGGTKYQDIINLFGAEQEENMKDAYRKARTYFPRMQPLAFALAEQKNGKKPVYIAYFDRKLPGDERGAFHTSELWYLFGTLGRNWRTRKHYMTGADYELSELMCRYWTNFMKTGNPNEEGLPNWNPFSKEEHVYQYFSEKGAENRRIENDDTAFIVSDIFSDYRISEYKGETNVNKALPDGSI
ncbi:MAG: carboxylesterase family protein [Lachnospiraceae bacterium]|nr:carboxylesterase family protein [Lachnospiraceae bacterium]